MSGPSPRSQWIQRWRPGAVGLLVTMILVITPAVAAAHLVGLYRAYLNDPEAAIADLEAQVEELETTLEDLAQQALAAEAQVETLQERAVTVVQFYDRLFFGFTLHALFGQHDLVDLLSHGRILQRMVQDDLHAMDDFTQQRAELVQTRAHLAQQRISLATREKLLLAIQESNRQRKAFLTAYPEPLTTLMLLLDWHDQADAAMSMLDHVARRLRDPDGLFEPGAEPDTWTMSQDRLLQHLLPLPANVAGRVDSIELYLLPDHAYFIISHAGRLTLVIADFEPFDRHRIRLTLETVLYQGFELPDVPISDFNRLRPLLLDLRHLSPRALSFELIEGALLIHP